MDEMLVNVAVYETLEDSQAAAPEANLVTEEDFLAFQQSVEERIAEMESKGIQVKRTVIKGEEFLAWKAALSGAYLEQSGEFLRNMYIGYIASKGQ